MGRPVPRSETKLFHLADPQDCLILAFVRMGGESRPWGIAIGRPDRPPRVLVAPEGRNRDEVRRIVVGASGELLKHLHTPGYCEAPPEEPNDLQPLRQVWLPNPTHLEMLHNLAYAYTFTKAGDDERVLLNAIGRASGWLFREAQRPGQQWVGVATDVLRQAYTFPAEDVRQGHLGFLLAWLTTPGDREARLRAALEAEKQPVATSLAPELERDELAELVEQWGRASANSEKSEISRRIESVLAPELERRWHQTSQALEALRTDPRRENSGLASLILESANDAWYQHFRGEGALADGREAYTPSVETDRNPAAAASRYFVHTSSSELLANTFVHDDGELFKEMALEGAAIQGHITSVQDIAPQGNGRKRTTQPVWSVLDATPYPLKLQVGSTVCVYGVPKREGRILSVQRNADGTKLIEIEITNWKARKSQLPGAQGLAPNAGQLEGERVGFVAKALDQLSRMKSQQIWKSDGPGAWLTHATARGGPTSDSDEASDSP
jgi:hypothetical protein